MPSWRTSTPTRPACGSCAVGPGSRPPSRLSPTTNQKRRDHTGLVLAKHVRRTKARFVLLELRPFGKEGRASGENWAADGRTAARLGAGPSARRGARLTAGAHGVAECAGLLGPADRGDLRGGRGRG